MLHNSPSHLISQIFPMKMSWAIGYIWEFFIFFQFPL